MIEAGTPDEIKESILGNMSFSPDNETFKQVKKCYEAQRDCKVLVVTVKYYQCGKGDSFRNWAVVVVTFKTKRQMEGALSKAIRAARAARLSLYQFTNNGKNEDGTFTYAVELRENE